MTRLLGQQRCSVDRQMRRKQRMREVALIRVNSALLVCFTVQFTPALFAALTPQLSFHLCLYVSFFLSLLLFLCFVYRLLLRVSSSRAVNIMFDSDARGWFGRLTHRDTISGAGVKRLKWCG